MAYLQQNPEDEKNQQNSQVLGPSGQPINQPQQQAPAGGASQPATIEGSQPGANVPQAPATKKPSSGQFTNLRNYLQASQGAGQKIGQQLTGGMQRQAQQVGKALEQQKAQYQAQIGQQEAQRAQAAQAAQATLNKLVAPQSKINNPNYIEKAQPQTTTAPVVEEERTSRADTQLNLNQAPQVDPVQDYLKNTLKDRYDAFQNERQQLRSTSWRATTPEERQRNNEALSNLYQKYGIDQQRLERIPYEISEQEVAKFRELATGQKTFKDVQDMNLAAEQVKQQQLAAQAEALKSFEGRAGQLRETFGKNRQYGQGSSTLDSLLLQRQGLPQVLETTKGIQQGLGEQIKGTKQFGSSELARLLQENKAFAQGLQTAAETGQTGVISAVDQLRAQRAAERAAQLQENLNPFLTQEQQELADLENYYGGEAVRQRLVDASRQRLGGGFEQNLMNSVINSNKQKAIANIPDKKTFESNRELKRKYGDYNNYREEMRLDIMRRQGSEFAPSPEQLNDYINQYIKTGQGVDKLAMNADDWDWRVQDILNTALTGKGSAIDADTMRNLGMSQKQIDDMFNRAGGRYVDANALNTMIGNIGSALQKQKTGLTSTLSDRLKEATGYGFEDYTTGRDLSRESVASEADRARYAALSALAGREATDLAFSRPAEAKAGTDLTRSQLGELLAKLSTEFGRANNSVPNTAGYGEPKKNIE